MHWLTVIVRAPVKAIQTVPLPAFEELSKAPTSHLHDIIAQIILPEVHEATQAAKELTETSRSSHGPRRSPSLAAGWRSPPAPRVFCFYSATQARKPTAVDTPGASVPDGRTIRHVRLSRSRNMGTDALIPVTNAIEALNAKLCRAVRARGHFPIDEAATKLLYLVLNRSEKEWKTPLCEWTMAMSQFSVIFRERLIKAMAA